ncbi:MAG TPA: hypothetical protein VGG34_14075 [Opitutaceae bacterium]|jgi:hypothetical protein
MKATLDRLGRAPRPAHRRSWLPGAPTLALGLCVAGCGAPSGNVGPAAGSSHLTALFSKTSNGYERPRNTDGTFKPETFVLKDGGNLGGPRADETIDSLKFPYISGVVGAALGAANYRPAGPGTVPDLLIVCYRGTTIVPDDVLSKQARPSDVSMAEASKYAVTTTGHQNDSGADWSARQGNLADAAAFSAEEAAISSRIDAQSANILGYTDDIRKTPARDPYLMTLRDEVESDRYYVVLLAYDCRSIAEFGVRRLVWESRISVPELGADFEKALPDMLAIASRYFGQDSGGLVRHDLAEGHVEIGKVTSLGPVPAK